MTLSVRRRGRGRETPEYYHCRMTRDQNRMQPKSAADAAPAQTLAQIGEGAAGKTPELLAEGYTAIKHGRWQLQLLPSPQCYR
jgi:hypothetical protein